ncbi:hypothetical protein GQ42DRAFT_165540 [Ramicandelaber brevisporus]|nr:hypothetical protein GQ42DRAFT_165540 [Ramicandelaber brevisporus]
MDPETFSNALEDAKRGTIRLPTGRTLQLLKAFTLETEQRPLYALSTEYLNARDAAYKDRHYSRIRRESTAHQRQEAQASGAALVPVELIAFHPKRFPACHVCFTPIHPPLRPYPSYDQQQQQQQRQRTSRLSRSKAVLVSSFASLSSVFSAPLASTSQLVTSAAVSIKSFARTASQSVRSSLVNLFHVPGTTSTSATTTHQPPHEHQYLDELTLNTATGPICSPQDQFDDESSILGSSADAEDPSSSAVVGEMPSRRCQSCARYVCTACLEQCDELPCIKLTVLGHQRSHCDWQTSSDAHNKGKSVMCTVCIELWRITLDVVSESDAALVGDISVSSLRACGAAFGIPNAQTQPAAELVKQLRWNRQRSGRRYYPSIQLLENYVERAFPSPEDVFCAARVDYDRPGVRLNGSLATIRQVAQTQLLPSMAWIAQLFDMPVHTREAGDWNGGTAPVTSMQPIHYHPVVPAILRVALQMVRHGPLYKLTRDEIFIDEVMEKACSEVDTDREIADRIQGVISRFDTSDLRCIYELTTLTSAAGLSDEDMIDRLVDHVFGYIASFQLFALNNPNISTNDIAHIQAPFTNNRPCTLCKRIVANTVLMPCGCVDLCFRCASSQYTRRPSSTSTSAPVSCTKCSAIVTHGWCIHNFASIYPS